ncbi:MAG TPA: Ig-like domain-containing protein, partial [Pyrinomonadaceae bacterium]|nr:Ig-like domain-containing protein [Pyrinomonadaceae bacterium]
MSSFRFLTAVVATLLFSVSALGQESSVTTVQVTPSTKEAEVGQSVKLSVTALDAAGKVIQEKPSTFFAGPFDVAAVDEDGNVKLFAAGEVTVGAIVGGKPGLATFMVKPPSIKSIEIDSLKSPILVGGTTQLNATTRIFNGDPRTGVPISWTSDNAQVATVDAGGVVIGVGPGKATITATSGAATTTTTVNVVKSNLRSLSVAGSARSARTGDVIRFSAKGDPAEDFATRWSVSGTGATIDADGGFVAERPGSYIVTATSGTISAS